MKHEDLDQYREIWLGDFEFNAKAGERQVPTCLVAHELRTDRRIRLFKEELMALEKPPYATDESSLFISYYSSAELNCHLALDWDLPANVLDLFVEFRNLTNGKKLEHGAGLLGAMSYFGLDCILATEKNEMRELAMRDGPWSEDEKLALLDYCESDVIALQKLLPKMLPRLDLPRALLRGRFMKVVAEMETRGIPVDVKARTLLEENWESIKERLIKSIDTKYGVFEGQSFRRHLFEKYLSKSKIAWPRLDSGELDLSDNAFKEVAKTHDEISPLRDLRGSLSKLRLSEIPVGSDGRNRTLLSPFRSRTGRSQPSNNKFIFGPDVWLRSLICPVEGWCLIYLDWSQQEFGIAAALSGDPNMIAAYNSGDPYLAFAKQAGAAPPEATKKTHEAVRDQYKACVLAVQYGMGEQSLALRIGQPVAVARQLLRMHKETYPKFWSWSDAVVDQAMLFGSLPTTFGWNIHVGTEANPRFLRNFPMQGNGAEMLRLACIFASERGVKLCATVHDAILIEAPLEEMDEAISVAQSAMSDASLVVLGGFRLNSEVKIIRHPERYSDPRGKEMWNRVWNLIEKPEFELK